MTVAESPNFVDKGSLICKIHDPMGLPVKPRRAVSVALLLLSTLGLPSTCYGDETSDTAKAAARALGEQGLAAMDQGDFARASDLMNRAYRIHRVPTLALWSGRVLLKLGKLVAAAERFREAVRLDPSGGEYERQTTAQQEASQALSELLPRIASVSLQLLEEAPESAVLTVDGNRVSTAVLGTSIPMDPGSHEVHLRWNATERYVSFRIGEGESKTIVLSETKEAQARNASRPTNARLSQSAKDLDSNESSSQSTAGWISLAVGGAGLGVAAVTGILVMGERNALADSCNNSVCPPGQYDALDRFHTMRTVSTAALVLGAVGLGTGTALLLTLPKSAGPRQSSVSVHTWIGLSGLGVGGSY